MKHKVFIIILFLEAFICIGFTLFNVTTSATAFMTISTFPFAQIAGFLRALSLSGMVGNLFATIIFILVGIIPLIFLSVILYKKKFRIEDTLLILTSTLLFATVYLMINPSYLSDMFILKNLEGYGQTMLGTTIYSVIIGYFVLKFMRIISKSETSMLLKYSKILLFTISVVLVYVIFGSQFNSLITNINAVKNQNTDSSILSLIPNMTVENTSVSFTNIFIIIFYILNQIPTLLDIIIVFMTINLIDELSFDRYSDNVITAANKLAFICKAAIITSMLTSIIVNITGMIFSKYLLKLDFSTTIPIISIVLVLIVLLSAKFFAESKKIKQDNDLFV